MPYNITYKIKNGNEKGFFFNRSAKKKKSEFANTGSVKGLGQNTSVNWCNVHKKENCTAGNFPCT